MSNTAPQTPAAPYRVFGAPGSPYSLKVRAALRAKRLPMQWHMADAEARKTIFHEVRAPVIPVIQTPGGQWTNDSTPFLLGLEAEGRGRSLLPDDPAARLACLIIEDMADEWTMKAMFHYRWAYGPDARQLSRWLVFDTLGPAGQDAVTRAASDIADRQISRMALVGCTEQTGPLIEASAKRVMAILDRMAINESPFLFGGRPSLADLALYGQLWQLRTDPTPEAVMRRDYPWLWRWLEHADDASGAEGDWTAELGGAARALLGVAGDTYLPFLKANLDALEAGETTFEFRLDGRPFTQGVFGYHVKCLASLRRAWQDASEPARDTVANLLGPNADVLADAPGAPPN